MYETSYVNVMLLGSIWINPSHSTTWEAHVSLVVLAAPGDILSTLLPRSVQCLGNQGRLHWLLGFFKMSSSSRIFDKQFSSRLSGTLTILKSGVADLLSACWYTNAKALGFRRLCPLTGDESKATPLGLPMLKIDNTVVPSVCYVLPELSVFLVFALGMW
jgi:hypothetical protein